MLKMKSIIVMLLSLFILLPLSVQADEASELKKKIMFDQKKLIVLQNMEFTAEEGEFFWPVYEEFQEKLFETNQGVARLIIAYAASFQTLTDDQALKIVDQYFTLENRRLNLMDTYMQKFAKGLPGKKVFRYMQVENKLAATARFELARQIPLAQ